MSCLRKLVLTFSLLAFLCPATASTNRLAALGGETRLLLDTSNLFLYPASAPEFSHLGVDFFDDWGGVTYPLRPTHTLGLFLNRPTPQLERFNTYLRQEGSPVFRELEARPWADLVWAVALREHLQIGLLGRFAYDRRQRDLSEASAASADLRVGFRLGTDPGHILDATFGLLHHRFEDASSEGAATTLKQTDGSGYLFDVRARLPLSTGLRFLPSAGFETGSYALAPAHRDYRNVHVALGLNALPGRNVLVVTGLLADYQQFQLHLPGQPDQKESTLVLPAVVIAGEARVGSLAFRLGLRHESVLTTEELFQDGRIATTRDFQTEFQTNLGLGLEFDALRLDGLLERDFLRDGPHLIGGSRHGGGLFSRLSLVYLFGD